MNRLGWLLFDVALIVRRYRYRSPRRQPRDFTWGQAIRAMGAWRVEATI